MTDLAKFIEHTILKPDCSVQDVRRLCEEALEYQFGGVCIPPLFVREARRILGEESKVRLATVAAYPMGYSAIAAKSEEIKRAIEEGADDIDGVINLAALKSDNWNHVANDIDSMARATHMRGRRLKLILECGLLTPADIRRVCEIAVEHKVEYVKTGTGFHGHPATPEMVRLLRAAAPAALKIKAAGGIRTRAEALALIEAGADRLGCSASLSLVERAVPAKGGKAPSRT